MRLVTPPRTVHARRSYFAPTPQSYGVREHAARAWALPAHTPRARFVPPFRLPDMHAPTLSHCHRDLAHGDPNIPSTCSAFAYLNLVDKPIHNTRFRCQLKK